MTYVLALCSFLCYQRTALARAFQSQQENVEVRIAAYQQLMTCPNQEIFTIVKTTLSNEKSSQGIELSNSIFITNSIVLHYVNTVRESLKFKYF